MSITYYQKLKENHICVCCRRRSAEEGKVRCSICAENGNKKCKESRNSLSKEDHEDALKFRRAKWKTTVEYRKKNGLCSSCGRKLNDKNYITCSKCRDYKREKSKSYYKRGKD